MISEPKTQFGTNSKKYIRVQCVNTYLSAVDDEDLVAAEDGGEAVRDDEQRAVRERLLQRRLHQGVRLGVDGRRRFVKYQDLRTTKDQKHMNQK